LNDHSVEWSKNTFFFVREYFYRCEEKKMPSGGQLLMPEFYSAIDMRRITKWKLVNVMCALSKLFL